VSLKNVKTISVGDRLFLKIHMEGNCENLTESFKKAFPARAAKMTDMSISVTASRLYDRLKKSVSFREMLEINGIDDASLVAEGKRLMRLKRPFFGPKGEVLEADDGPTQAKVWDRFTELRGHGTGKNQINVSGSGPLNISFGTGRLDEDNVEVSQPEPEESEGENPAQ
jgi:hypothetical protein